MKKKSVALVLALALVVVCIVGGTLAWLTATTGEVKNTFTTSDVNITLSETAGGQNHEFQMIPGYTITKDPKVTVIAGSEKCYLFVKLEKSANFVNFLTCDIADGWTQLQDENNAAILGVYYRIVDTTGMGTAYSVLKDDQVTVLDTVTKEQMNSFDTNKDGELSGTEKEAFPYLTVTAYASQYMKNNTDHFKPYEAWSKVQP